MLALCIRRVNPSWNACTHPTGGTRRHRGRTWHIHGRNYGRGAGASCLPVLTHSCSRRKIAPARERAAALGSAADEPASGARSEVVGAGAELRLLSIDLNITQPKGGFPFNSQPQAQHKTADHTVRLRYTACRSAALPVRGTTGYCTDRDPAAPLGAVVGDVVCGLWLWLWF